MDKRILYHLPWVIWLGIIFFLSCIPGNRLPDLKIEWVSVDTVAHLGMYFGLSVWFLFGFLSKEQKAKKKLNLSDFRLYGVVILVGICIGYSIELIQGNFIYRRYFDIEDLVANVFGTIFGAISYGWIGRKLI